MCWPHATLAHARHIPVPLGRVDPMLADARWTFDSDDSGTLLAQRNGVVRRGVIGVVAWVLAGCGLFSSGVRPELTLLDGARCEARPGRTADTVEMFFGAQLPEQPFDRIALVELSGPGHMDTKALLSALRVEAARCGADALIAVDKKFGVQTRTYIFSDDEDVDERGIVTGVAVAYRPPAQFEHWDD